MVGKTTKQNLAFPVEQKTGHLNTIARQNEKLQISVEEKYLRRSIHKQIKKTSQEDRERRQNEYTPIPLLQPIRQIQKLEDYMKTAIEKKMVTKLIA